MARVFVEPRPKGRDGDPIYHYVVEAEGGHVHTKTDTQAEAIDWAKEHGHSPVVARVRHLDDKRKPDYWRAV